MAPTQSAETNGTDDSKPKVQKSTSDGPTVPSWISEDYFIDTLKEIVKGFKKILKFEAGLTGGGGENYASVMIRIKIKVEIEGGSTKDLSFMIKTLPQGGQGAMMVNMMGLFPKETAMYGKYLPEFEQMYRDVGKTVKLGPKNYRLKRDPGVEYVLLEDISPQGFKNVNRLEGLDRDHTESVLKILAELHAVSAVRVETKGPFDKIFTEPIFKEEQRETLDTMMSSMKKVFLHSLTKYSIGQKYLEKATKLCDLVTDMYITLSVTDPNDFNVMVHGDLWSNNIMFRHNDSGEREETLLIDYQMSRYSNPVADLYYFLISSPSLDIKISRFDDSIKFYHDHLVENLKLLKYPKEIPTMKELRNQLLKQGFWAFTTSIGILGAILLDPTENANIDNFLEDTAEGSDFKAQMFNNPRYVKHLEALLPWMDARGLLDS